MTAQPSNARKLQTSEAIPTFAIGPEDQPTECDLGPSDPDSEMDFQAWDESVSTFSIPYLMICLCLGVLLGWFAVPWLQAWLVGM